MFASEPWEGKNLIFASPWPLIRGFPGGSVVKKNPLANVGAIGDTGSIPGSGGSLGKGNDNPLQYSCLENPTDRGVWWATVHRIAQSQTELKRLSTQHAHALSNCGDRASGGGSILERRTETGRGEM